ncbi:MAG: peptide chain release factor N(5)-glutamine methyltransferase [Deltaproteobacteria bacterium]|nr:peptide chain release factor N(5)-glutamine methyltransferase [Deltaproteobacteria bacterium]
MTAKTWIIKDLLPVSTDYLKTKNIESPRLCAEILLSHQLSISRLKLYLEYDQPVGENDLIKYRAMIKRVAEGEPIQYITGLQEFWSMDFIVNRGVLIPRAETEILVEQVIRVYKENNYIERTAVNILDICTGSGAIAVAIASEIKNAEIIASDISKEALNIAWQNITRHEMQERITLIEGDLFEPFNGFNNHFDIIVSNPPYVTKDEYRLLPVKIREFEPKIALESGVDGLFHIRSILENAPNYLKPGGWLMLEMDPSQTETVTKIISKDDSFLSASVVKDYSNRDRVVTAQKKME